uniref:ankyrin repeat domain-containing protein 27-like n=1 Tax=Styela clava TaxID=7725 RepID=UPI00193AB216|nr:ankyrin repeat domain-containing protein 27-like [Styela clava]
MDDYDEDLSENPWYLAFVHNHDKLFLQATNGRWIVCIPRSGSWKGGSEAPKTFSSSYFESHCIKFDCEEVSQQSKKEDDIAPSPAVKHINKYLTYNGKTILVEGSKMSCGLGFEEVATSFDSRSEKLDLPGSGLKHTARILFEETYFNANDQSYKMLCVSRPLELHLVSGQEFGEEESPLSPIAGGFKFSSEKLRGQQLWRRANNSQKLKNNVDSKISAYLKSHGSGKTIYTTTLPSANSSQSSNIDGISGIDVCVTSVQDLYNMCLQIVVKDSKIKKEVENNLADTTKVQVENYVLQEIYKSVFRQISCVVPVQEAAFNKMICNLFDIQPLDLEIDKKYWLSLPRSRRQLSRINKCCTPNDKLSCIQHTISCITAKQENAIVGSDDLLPILIYLIIKCNIPNWITNLIYLQHFRFNSTQSEQFNFYLSTMEAAIEHIKNGGVKMCRQISKNGDVELSSIQKYFKDIQNGDLDSVKQLLSMSANERKKREQNRCHPLCACEKCTEMKRRSATISSTLITVQTRNDKGQTALHIAAVSGHHELVDSLVDHGSELNATDYHGSTPLHCAALSGSQSVVFLLMHHGANPNARDNNSNTPLHLCCQRGHEACAKAFLYFDPTVSVESINVPNDEGDRPLHIASKWGYDGIVSALLECGANPKVMNKRRENPTDVSLNLKVSLTIKTAAAQAIRIVRTLRHLQSNMAIEHSPSNKSPEKRSRPRTITPKELQNTSDNAYVAKQVEKLFRAVTDNDINMVRFLCGWHNTDNVDDNDDKARLKPDVPSSCDPLCQCPKCNPVSHEHVLHVNSSNQEKYTGLMLASKHGFLEMAKLFVEQGASINTKTKRHEYSPLHFACESGHSEIAELILMQEGANADIRDIFGSTPLYMCAIYNHLDCAVVLLKHHASVNIRNRNGDTPLHVAVKWKNKDIIKILLDNGGLVYYKNNDGQNPIDFANKDPEIKRILLSVSALEESLSSTPLSPIGISPHTATPPLADSSGISDLSVSSAHPDSLSAHDEAIADELYTKFKDPPPSTPPQCGSLDNSCEENIDHVDKCIDFEDNNSFDPSATSGNAASPRKASTGVSVTSDIFRDLLQETPSTTNFYNDAYESTSYGEASNTPMLSAHVETEAVIANVDDVFKPLTGSDLAIERNEESGSLDISKEEERVEATDSYFEIG